jgi:hypothetical protein
VSCPGAQASVCPSLGLHALSLRLAERGTGCSVRVKGHSLLQQGGHLLARSSNAVGSIRPWPSPHKGTALSFTSISITIFWAKGAGSPWGQQQESPGSSFHSWGQHY